MAFASRFLIGITILATLIPPGDVFSVTPPRAWFSSDFFKYLKQIKEKQSSKTTPKTDIRLGLLIPYEWQFGVNENPLRSAKYYASAISIAIDEINNSKDLLPNHKLSFVWNDTACEEDKAIRQQISMATAKRPVDVVIGPGCHCKGVARNAAANNLPVISYMCSNPELSNKKLYSTFARTASFGHQLTPSLIALLEKYNWRKVALIIEQSHRWEAISEYVKQEFAVNGISVAYQNRVPTEYMYQHKLHAPKLAEIMKGIKASARIVIYLCDTIVAREGMLAAYNHSMINGQYVFIMMELTSEELKLKYETPSMWLLPHYYETFHFRQQVRRAFEAVLIITVNRKYTKTNSKFETEVKRRMKEPPFKSDAYMGMLPGTNFSRWDTPLPLYSANLYDAVNFYAIALNKTISKGQDIRDGRAVFDNLRNTTYTSINGYQIYMDRNGDVQMDTTLLDFQYSRWGSPRTVEVGDFDVKIGRRDRKKLELKLRENRGIHWPVFNNPPKDTPKCGFKDELCQKGR